MFSAFEPEPEAKIAILKIIGFGLDLHKSKRIVQK